MKFKKVSQEKLRNLVAEFAPKLPENVVFLAGARTVKNDQVEIEFVQCRALAGRKTSLLGALNEGDSRFNTGKTVMRVWMIVSALGFKNRFPGVEIDIEEVKAECAKLEAGERLALLKQVQTVTVDEIAHPVKIVCLETIHIDQLPKSIRENLTDPEVSDEIKERYILQTGGDKTQHIVDEAGNKVYRHFLLDYGQAEDKLVENKMLISDYKERKTKGTASDKTATNVLGELEKELQS